ncbi:unnamed protein product [Auanema sp. JU1783]|nr:unnamed protein product [Auanema sp. JU1783]
MGSWLLGLLILLPLASCTLEWFDEDLIFSFINKSQTLDVTDECRVSLSRVESYLKDQATLESQRIFFSESFGKGPSNLFLSRDQDRWIYKGYECLLAAGETIYSKSEHPMHYCYTYDDDDEHELKRQSKQSALSVCIPTPCASDNPKLLREWRRLIAPKEDNLPLPETTCTKSRHEKQWFEKFVPVADLAFNLLLLMLVIMATIFHHMRGEQVKSFSAQVMMAFSLKRNLKKLTSLPKDPQSCITCLCGIRVLSMIWTLAGHSFIFVQAYLENVQDYKDDLVDNFGNQWITNFTLSVDTFLVLGGTVLSYSWFRKWLKNTTESEPTWTSWGYWLRFYRHRIVRLWPAYLYTIMCVTLRISVTHFHPMWPPTDPGVQCPKHWYENVLFINSLFNNRCMPWTWYIGTEFIFYIVSPVFLLLLRQRPNVGWFVCVGTIAASAGLNTLKIVERNFPPTQFLWKQPEIFNPNFIQHHIELYIKPQYRIGPYIVGILLGYYLARYQRQPVKLPRSKQFIVVGWIVGLSCFFWGMYGLYPALQGWDWPIYHLIYGSIHRDVFAVGVSWIIYACHTDLGGWLNYLLSAKPLLPLSNLCYSAYLFHMIPVVLTYLLAPFPFWYSTKWSIVAHCVVQLAISYLFAMICTMTVEYPALNIERILLAPRPKTTLKPVVTAEADEQLKPQ